MCECVGPDAQSERRRLESRASTGSLSSANTALSSGAARRPSPTTSDFLEPDGDGGATPTPTQSFEGHTASAFFF